MDLNEPSLIYMTSTKYLFLQHILKVTCTYAVILIVALYRPVAKGWSEGSDDPPFIAVGPPFPAINASYLSNNQNLYRFLVCEHQTKVHFSEKTTHHSWKGRYGPAICTITILKCQ